MTDMKPDRPITYYLKQLKNHPELEPRAEYRRNARIRILNQLDPVETQTSRALTWNGWRLVRLAGSLATALALAGSGVAYAAQGSAPGTPLYPLKLKTEEIAKTLSPTREMKTDVVEEIIDRRASEVQQLEDSDTDSKDVKHALDRYEKTVSEATVSSRINPEHIEKKIQNHAEKIEEIKGRIRNKRESPQKSKEEDGEKHDDRPVTPTPTITPSRAPNLPDPTPEPTHRDDTKEDDDDRTEIPQSLPTGNPLD